MEVWWFPTLQLTTSACSSVSRRPTETKSNREPQESDIIGPDKSQQSFTGLFLNQILSAKTKTDNHSQVCFWIRYYRPRQKPTIIHRFAFESDIIGQDKNQLSFTGLLLNQILSAQTKTNYHSQVSFLIGFLVKLNWKLITSTQIFLVSFYRNFLRLRLAILKELILLYRTFQGCQKVTMKDFKKYVVPAESH